MAQRNATLETKRFTYLDKISKCFRLGVRNDDLVNNLSERIVWILFTALEQ